MADIIPNACHRRKAKKCRHLSCNEAENVLPVRGDGDEQVAEEDGEGAAPERVGAPGAAVGAGGGEVRVRAAEVAAGAAAGEEPQVRVRAAGVDAGERVGHRLQTGLN